MEDYPFCRLCGGRTDRPDLKEGYCAGCHSSYSVFCEELPPTWDRMTHGHGPRYEEWVEEQLINKQVAEGKLTVAEGQRQVMELIKKAQKRLGYGPDADTPPRIPFKNWVLTHSLIDDPPR